MISPYYLKIRKSDIKFTRAHTYAHNHALTHAPTRFSDPIRLTCNTFRLSFFRRPSAMAMEPSRLIRLQDRSRTVKVMLTFSAAPMAFAPSLAKPFQEAISDLRLTFSCRNNGSLAELDLTDLRVFSNLAVD